MLTVDEEIYRLTPALVIATVDKLAQLPWEAATATLFGLVDTECTRHGWQNPDFSSFCGPGGHRAAGEEPPGEIRPAIRLRPPDLIIQDELHLISDALGSMVGLYETAIDRLCSRPGPPVRRSGPWSSPRPRRCGAPRIRSEQVFARGADGVPAAGAGRRGHVLLRDRRSVSDRRPGGGTGACSRPASGSSRWRSGWPPRSWSTRSTCSTGTAPLPTRT